MEINVNGVQITLTEEQLIEIKRQTLKLSIEKKILGMWYGCAVKFNFDTFPNRIFIVKDDKIMCEHRLDHKFIYVNYDLVWSVIEKEYSLDYDDTQYFLCSVVKKYFIPDLLEVTTDRNSFVPLSWGSIINYLK